MHLFNLKKSLVFLYICLVALLDVYKRQGIARLFNSLYLCANKI